MLPRALGSKVELDFCRIGWGSPNGVPGPMSGTIVKVLTSCSAARNDGLHGEERLLVDAGDWGGGLILLGTPKQRDLPPRVQAALVLASQCLM